MKMGGSRAVTSSLNILTANIRRSFSAWPADKKNWLLNESTSSKTSWRETRVPSTSSRGTFISNKNLAFHKNWIDLSRRSLVYPVENPLPNLRARYFSSCRVFNCTPECKCSRFWAWRRRKASFFCTVKLTLCRASYVSTRLQWKESPRRYCAQGQPS